MNVNVVDVELEIVMTSLGGRGRSQGMFVTRSGRSRSQRVHATAPLCTTERLALPRQERNVTEQSGTEMLLQQPGKDERHRDAVMA